MNTEASAPRLGLGTKIKNVIFMAVPAGILPLVAGDLLRKKGGVTLEPGLSGALWLGLFLALWLVFTMLANRSSSRKMASVAAAAREEADLAADAEDERPSMKWRDLAIYAMPVVGAAIGMAGAQWLSMGWFGHCVMALLGAGAAGMTFYFVWAYRFHGSRESVTVNAVKLWTPVGTSTNYTIDHEPARAAIATNHERALAVLPYISLLLLTAGFALILAGFGWSIFSS